MHNRLLVLFLIACATPAHAQTEPTISGSPTISDSHDAPHISYDASFSRGSGAIPALPLEIMKSGTIRYINGGISDEELTQVKAQANHYNMHIMLSAPQGEYISNVRLRVLAEDASTLLDVAEAGPYLYAQLPAGKYTLETTNPGEAANSISFEITARNGFTKHITYNQ